MMPLTVDTMPKTKTPKLDKTFLDAVSPAIYSTWQYIGSDSMNCAAECGEDLDNHAAVQGTLDAGYIERQGYRPVSKLLEAAYDAHGYEAVERYLVKHIRLI